MMPDVTPPTVNQPNWPPTNKLLSMTLVPVLVNIIVRLAERFEITPWLAADAEGLRELASLVIGFAVTYWLVRDKPNQPELVARVETAEAEVQVLKEVITEAPGLTMPPLPSTQRRP